ncbi:MAG: hypothetical protein HFH53_12180 [Hespellia sp.]|jgi:hypothetical protein|nr:hypothetical protein [Hespellia sp.]
MENRQELLLEILKRMQKNYMHITEIERLTKEMGDALSRNDQESVQLLLQMRQEEMDQADVARNEMRMITEVLSPEDRSEVEALFTEENVRTEDFESTKIVELSRQIMRVRERVIAIDQTISSKLAGKESYYQSR